MNTCHMLGIVLKTGDNTHLVPALMEFTFQRKQTKNKHIKLLEIALSVMMQINNVL